LGQRVVLPVALEHLGLAGRLGGGAHLVAPGVAAQAIGGERGGLRDVWHGLGGLGHRGGLGLRRRRR
ncbi:MAG: hypothetical protein ACK56I_27590, partial [bacterium]